MTLEHRLLWRLVLTTRSNSMTLISFLSKNYPNNVNFIYRKFRRYRQLSYLHPSFLSFVPLSFLFFYIRYKYLESRDWIFRVFFEWTAYINVFFPLSRDSWEIRSEFSLFFNVYIYNVRCDTRWLWEKQGPSVKIRKNFGTSRKISLLLNYFLRFSKRRRRKISRVINETTVNAASRKFSGYEWIVVVGVFALVVVSSSSSSSRSSKDDPGQYIGGMHIATHCAYIIIALREFLLRSSSIFLREKWLNVNIFQAMIIVYRSSIETNIENRSKNATRFWKFIFEKDSKILDARSA